MVHFIGAGPGAADLITVRGQRLLQEADVVIYAGSLVNPALLESCRPDCEKHNSAFLTLEEVLAIIADAEAAGKTTARLHTGDPSVYGAIREQMDALDRMGISFTITPGVSSVFGAAAALGAEFTLPGVSQTVILTRMAGRTPVPEAEQLSKLAAHGSSMAIFLSAGMLDGVQAELLKGAYTPDTPAAIVYKTTWPDERVCRCTVGTLAKTGRHEGITKTALLLIGGFLAGEYERSCLYAPDFTTEFRAAAGEEQP